MAEKYSVASQAAGTVNFKRPVEDISNPGVTQVVNIPPGMICIGPNGKGYVISGDSEYTFTPPISGPNSYVLFATAPIDSSGYATLSHDTYSNYVAGGGDNDNRRAFCYFLVTSSNIIDPTSFITFSDSVTVDDSRTIPVDGIETDVKLNNQMLNHLKKMGFYLNNRPELGFTYRGQNYIEKVSLHTSVENWDLVYYNLDDNKYHPAIANDTYQEVVVGIAEKDRDGITENNFLITSGLVEVGTDKLPNAEYPAGTFLYLCESTTLPDGTSGLGKIVRDFDGWTEDHAYSLGDRIAEITDDTEKTGWIMEVTVAGQSDSSTEPTWAGITAIGESISGDGTVTWTAVGTYTANYLGDRNVRIGISMGNGVMLLHSASSTQVDDHNDSPYAHNDIQAALNKAGIYVINTAKGLTTHTYRGQMFDEKATFGGATTFSVGDVSLVYRSTTGQYRKAIAESVNSYEQEVVGVSFDVIDDGLGGYKGMVLSNGFINYDTSGFSVGQKLYLSNSAPGLITNITGLNIFVGYCIVSATAENGGLIALQISGSGVHNADPESHPLIQDALRRAGIFVAGGYTHTYVGQSYDTDTTTHPLDSSLENYDIVYYGDYDNDGASPKYRRATATGDERGNFVGMILDDGTFTQVIASGFVEIPQMGGTNILPDATFPAGTDVYLTTELTGNCYSVDVSSIKIGVSLGGGVLLLQVRGAGGSGSGDMSFEDYTYMGLWDTNAFNQVYYDRFDTKETVTLSGAEYVYSDRGYYTGDGGDYIEYEYNFNATGTSGAGGSNTVLIDDGDVPFTNNTKVKVGDTILNTTDGSSATIVSIDNAEQLTTTALTGGSDNTWGIDDTWVVTHEFGRFLVHADYDDAADLLLEFWDHDSGGSWVEQNFDEEFSSVADQSSVKIRLTWTGSGDVRSYGILFDYSYGPYGMSRLQETYILPAAVGVNVDITIPRNGRYINNNKSLLVYRNGKLQERVLLPLYGGDGTGDYVEKNNTQITVKTSGGWALGDRIQFIEPYSQWDASASNSERLLLEHTVDGAHLLQDKVTDDWYLLEVHNGQLKLIPQN